MVSTQPLVPLQRAAIREPQSASCVRQSQAVDMATFGGVDLTTLGTKRPRAPLEVHDAVRRCDAPRLKQLLESGAALTEVDDSGCTPMHLAVQLGSDFALAMMTILLSVDEDERADALVALADDGLSPYHLCARTGQPKLMAVLLDSVDDDMREDVLEMRTHLRGELWNGNWGKKAADGELEELDVEHMTLLHLALERLEPNEEEDDDDDAPPLSDAARAEAVEMVRLLLERGADINATDAKGRAPLHQAVRLGESGLHLV